MRGNGLEANCCYPGCLITSAGSVSKIMTVTARMDKLI